MKQLGTGVALMAWVAAVALVTGPYAARVQTAPAQAAAAGPHLPAEKLLIEADAYTPPAPGAPRALAAVPGAPVATPVINPTAWNLYENIQRLELDVDRVVPLHGPGAIPIAELATAVGAER